MYNNGTVQSRKHSSDGFYFKDTKFAVTYCFSKAFRPQKPSGTHLSPKSPEKVSRLFRRVDFSCIEHGCRLCRVVARSFNGSNLSTCTECDMQPQRSDPYNGFKNDRYRLRALNFRAFCWAVGVVAFSFSDKIPNADQLLKLMGRFF